MKRKKRVYEMKIGQDTYIRTRGAGWEVVVPQPFGEDTRLKITNRRVSDILDKVAMLRTKIKRLENE